MWRLTVGRNYKIAISEIESDMTDRVHFETNSLYDLERIIEYFDYNAVDGEYEYRISRKEEGEENA